MTPEEKKEKLILTDNRMVTVNKRETSMQRIVDSLENGEDGLWHMTIENDKNILLTHKKELIELSKKYSDENVRKIINAVLDKIVKEG